MKFGKRQIITTPIMDKYGNFSQEFIQYNGNIQKLNQITKKHDDQYTKGHEFKLKCRIPEVDFLKYSHRFFKNGVIDEKELDKWLDSPDGEHCKVSRGSAKYV